jgi:hypothetical protein
MATDVPLLRFFALGEFGVDDSQPRHATRCETQYRETAPRFEHPGASVE